MLARSWESLACRHGCVETCTFGGSEWGIMNERQENRNVCRYDVNSCALGDHRKVSRY